MGMDWSRRPDNPADHVSYAEEAPDIADLGIDTTSCRYVQFRISFMFGLDFESLYFASG
jgi:hypothetical protein